MCGAAQIERRGPQLAIQSVTVGICTDVRRHPAAIGSGLVAFSPPYVGVPGFVGVGDYLPAGERPGFKGFGEDLLGYRLIIHIHREETPVTGFSPPAPVKQAAYGRIVVETVGVVGTVVYRLATQGHARSKLGTNVEGHRNDDRVGGVGGCHTGILNFDGGFVHPGRHVRRHIHRSGQRHAAIRRYGNRSVIRAHPGSIYFLVEIYPVVKDDILVIRTLVQVTYADEHAIQHPVERIMDPHLVAVARRTVVREAAKLPAIQFGAGVVPGQFLCAIRLCAKGAGVIDEVDDAVAILVFPHVAVAVDVLPVINRQVEAVIPTVVVFRIQGIVIVHLTHNHQVGAGGDGDFVGCAKALQRDEKVKGFEEIVAVCSPIRTFGRNHGGRNRNAKGLRIDQLHPIIAHGGGNGACGGIIDVESRGIGLAWICDVRKTGIIVTPEITRLPFVSAGIQAILTTGDQRPHISIDRTGTLCEGVVVQVSGGGHQQVLSGQEIGPIAIGILIGLVDKRQDTAGYRRRAAGATPGRPRPVTIEHTPGGVNVVVELLSTGCKSTAGNHVRTARAARPRATVGERRNVVVHDLHGAGNAIPTGRTILGGSTHTDGRTRTGRRYRPIGRGAIAG